MQIIYICIYIFPSYLCCCCSHGCGFIQYSTLQGPFLNWLFLPERSPDVTSSKWGLWASVILWLSQMVRYLTSLCGLLFEHWSALWFCCCLFLPTLGFNNFFNLNMCVCLDSVDLSCCGLRAEVRDSCGDSLVCSLYMRSWDLFPEWFWRPPF